MPAKTTASKPAKPAAAPVKGVQIGVVDSDKRAKTRRVVVSYMTMHPKYGKFVRRRTVLHVHDEENAAKVGDVVEVAPCRPISKTKSWKLVRIVEKRADEAAALASVKDIQ
jgi:small subunit ribosomal protein S17